MSRYIYSTLTASQKYPLWDTEKPNDMPRMKGYVLIRGGANLANKHFITPKGVVTKVTDDEFTILEQSPAFNRHVKRGFLKVEKKNIDIEKITSGMEGHDDSAPLTENDVIANDEKPPISKDPDAPAAQQSVEDRTNRRRTRDVV